MIKIRDWVTLTPGMVIHALLVERDGEQRLKTSSGMPLDS